MNKINAGGWVAINCIPTAVHTMAGALVGKLFLSDTKDKIKHIATSSFTLASLGLCLLSLAFFYWWIDMLHHRHYLQFWTIVGMNSLFISSLGLLLPDGSTGISELLPTI